VASSTGLPTSANYYGTSFGTSTTTETSNRRRRRERGLQGLPGRRQGQLERGGEPPATSGGFGDVRVADMNKDGNADIVAATTGIKYYKGNGAGGFTDATSARACRPRTPGEGSPSGRQQGRQPRHRRHERLHHAEQWHSGLHRRRDREVHGRLDGLPGSQDRDSSIVFADFNSDGNLDLVAGGAAGVSVYYGNGGSGGTMSWTSSGTGCPRTGSAA